MNQPPAIVARRKLSDWYRPNHIHPQNIPEAIVRTVLDRVDPQDLQTFLEPSIESIPSPLSLKNIRKATQLFIEALTNRKKIVIVGDYDADGICSVTLIIRFLKEIRYDNAQYFIPNRFDHGYGLTDTALPLILNLNPDLIITVDNGISAQKEIDHLMKRGISVIVTDHHALPTNSLPNCTILNPKQRECRFPFKDISGVGVTYLFLIAIRMEMRSQGFWSDRRSEPNLLKHLDLVALGTVTDQVPLLGLNRIFVRNGLKQMTKQIQRGYGSRFFFYLKMFAEHRAIRFFNCESIGYYLGPLLNAAGRMEDASLAVRFLLSDSESEANKNLQALNRLNNKRKRLQDSMTKKAQKQAASLAKLHSGILICDDTFHEGLIGIVANRLSDLFQLPSIVATAEKNGNIKSSCRSKHINILAVLKECDAHLLQYGGMPMLPAVVFVRRILISSGKIFIRPVLILRHNKNPISSRPILK